MARGAPSKDSMFPVEFSEPETNWCRGRMHVRREGWLDRERWLLVDALLASLPRYADFHKEYGCFVCEARPVLGAFVRAQTQLFAHVTQWIACDFSVAEVERLAQGGLQGICPL